MHASRPAAAWQNKGRPVPVQIAWRSFYIGRCPSVNLAVPIMCMPIAVEIRSSLEVEKSLGQSSIQANSFKVLSGDRTTCLPPPWLNRSRPVAFYFWVVPKLRRGPSDEHNFQLPMPDCNCCPSETAWFRAKQILLIIICDLGIID